MLPPGLVVRVLPPGLVVRVLPPGLVVRVLPPGLVVRVLPPGLVVRVLPPGLVVRVLPPGLVVRVLPPGLVVRVLRYVMLVEHLWCLAGKQPPFGHYCARTVPSIHLLLRIFGSRLPVMTLQGRLRGMLFKGDDPNHYMLAIRICF